MSNGSVCTFFNKLYFQDCSHAVEWLILKPAKILLILLLGFVASRLAARVTRRFINSLASRATVQARSDRAPKRASAIASTAAGIARVVVWITALLLVLGEMKVNLAPFIAGATVIGAALGFGAQSLVKDLLAGVMILTEDQYAVGDTIFINGTSGIVEDVNLLRSRIRADDGKVWFIANGEIRKVANASLGWSRAMVDLQLPYETDLDAAVAAASSEAGAMAQEPEWRDAVLAPPEAYGAEVKVEGVTVRVTAKTRPAVSAAVGRVLLERVARRIRRGGGGSGGGGSGGSGGGGAGGAGSPRPSSSSEPEVAAAASDPAAG
jgi:small conductance mechanosensitive channel